MAQAAAEPQAKARKQATQRRDSRQVMAADVDPIAVAEKTTPGAEVAALKSALGIWCPIHKVDSHDTKDCRAVHGMADARRKRYADPDVSGNCFIYDKPRHHARECPVRQSNEGRGAAKDNKGGPPVQPLRPLGIQPERKKKTSLTREEEYPDPHDTICLRGEPSRLPPTGR